MKKNRTAERKQKEKGSEREEIEWEKDKKGQKRE